MARLTPLLLLSPLLVAASTPVRQESSPLQGALMQARAEQAAAEAEAARLTDIARRSESEAQRLKAEEMAAAQSLEAAEARITAADAQLQMVSALLERHRARLAQEQLPVSSLLAGLAMMAQRPPLLAIASRGTTDDFVRVRVLLDSTLPVIRNRTGALSAELARNQKLEEQAVAFRNELKSGQAALANKRQEFAALEQRALQRAAAVGGQALGAGDVALAAGEDVEALGRAQASGRSASALASQLAAIDPAPPRPAPAEGPRPQVSLAYRLPADAAVTDGLGSVDSSGIQSRGLTLATARGAQVIVPASGVVRFSGPFRRYDGVVIIDHGRGWISLIVNVASSLKPGDRVVIGQPLGRALGPLLVELSQNGARISPALIAGSSGSLSNGPKDG